MIARTHDIIAFASLITIAIYQPPNELNITTSCIAIVGSVVGSLIPDMDQASNRLWDLLPAGNFFGKIFKSLMLQHRTISHSILGVYLFYQILNFVMPKLLNPAYVNPQIVVISIMIGLISHILADMITKEGVPLLVPFPFKIGIPPFEFLRFTTGKFIEKFIIFPGVILYILWIIINKKEALLSLVRMIKY